MQVSADPGAEPCGQFFDTYILTPFVDGSDLVRLHKERAFGRPLDCLGALLYSSEEALYLLTEVRALTSISSSISDCHGGTYLTADAVFQRCCEAAPDFPQRYAAYRHFRLQGWVVRPDAFKFGADFLLYDGLPNEVHAQYAAVLASPGILWKEVLASSRLATLVAKEVLLVLATDLPSTPTPGSCTLAQTSAAPVAEIVVKRWSPHLG